METQNVHDLLEVLQFCQAHSIPARVVGSWVWVEYETKPAKATRQMLLDFGFKWSPRREQWAHNCGCPANPAQNYEPWDKYETYTVEEVLRSKLQSQAKPFNTSFARNRDLYRRAQSI